MARKKPDPTPPPDIGGPLTLLELRAQNVKRLTAVRILPPDRTGTVEIAGKNGQGKSSTLDTFVMVTGGKDASPARPIREGETRAEGEVVFQGRQGREVFRAKRRWTPNGNYLDVLRADGTAVPSPQAFLEGLMGAGLGFDPGRFATQRPAEQVRMLLDVLKLDRDPRELEAERKRLYDERTAVNREAGKIKAQLEGIPEAPADTPAAEVSVAELTTEHARLTEQDRAYNAARREADTARTEQDRWVETVKRLRKELADAELAAQGAAAAVVRTLEALQRTPQPDFTGLTQQMQEAEEVNGWVRLRREREATVATLQAVTDQAVELTQQIEQIDEEKRQLLADAPFPVPGLGFAEVGGEWCVTYQGIPLEQASQSEKLRVGFGIFVAQAPAVRVALIREGSLLDEDSRRVVDEMARAHECHVLMEVVGDGDEGAFVIVDGGVATAPTRAAATGKPAAKAAAPAEPEW